MEHKLPIEEALLRSADEAAKRMRVSREEMLAHAISELLHSDDETTPRAAKKKAAAGARPDPGGGDTTPLHR